MVMFPTTPTIRTVLTAAVLVAWFTLNAHGAGLALAQINQGIDHVNGARAFVSSVESGGSIYDQVQQ